MSWTQVSVKLTDVATLHGGATFQLVARNPSPIVRKEGEELMLDSR